MNKFLEQKRIYFNGKCDIISLEMLTSLGSDNNKAKTSGVENVNGGSLPRRNKVGKIQLTDLARLSLGSN